MIEIKTTPYRSSLEPIKDSKDTVISLMEDRMEYFINYTYVAEFHIPHEEFEECVTEKEDCVIYDKGVLTKDDITSISVYTEDYGKTENFEDRNELSYIVGIYNGIHQVNIKVKDRKEANRIYKEVYNWKFNIKTEDK